MTAELIERCAEAAYQATMTMRDKASLPFEPWAKLPVWWQRIYRVQARAVLDATAEAVAAPDSEDWAGHPEAPVSESELQQLITEDYSGGKLAWR